MCSRSSKTVNERLPSSLIDLSSLQLRDARSKRSKAKEQLESQESHFAECP